MTKTADGTAYDIFGPQHAPAVVLIHGLGMTRATWDNIVPVLALNFRVITYDLSGHGESKLPGTTPSLTVLSQQLKALLEALSISQAALVGFSLGGMINRRFAIDHRDMASALVVLNSPHERDPAAQRLVEERAAKTDKGGAQATIQATLERWFTPEFRAEHIETVAKIRGWVLANNPENDSFLFIADLHSLTQIKDPKQLKENTLQVAATWLACGLNPEKTTFYRQSDVAQCTELSWYLNCFFPYKRLKLAHSFKDKSDRLEDVNSGLFAYPMLMASDILLYDANFVPVGKDQLQHLEMTRDVASRINHKYGEVFIIPEAKLQKDAQLIPGTDGEKMSKSRENTIDLFMDEKSIKKIINKKIENTDYTNDQAMRIYLWNLSLIHI